jgi:trehalose/maltose hydrolase-like predicted phosphorylase
MRTHSTNGWNDDARLAPVCISAAKSFQATIGNGEIGLQGSDSGLAGSRCFMVGVVDLTPDDLHRPALLPTWNAIDLRLPGGASLAEAFAAGRHSGYRQQLDTTTATLRTQYRIELGGIGLRVEVETWLSRADRHLGAVHVQLTADRDCTVEARVGVTANITVERHPFRSLRWPHADFPRQYAGGFFEKRMTYAWHPGHMDVVATAAGEASWGTAAVAAHDGPAAGVAIALGGDIDSADAGGMVTLRLPAGSTRCLLLHAAFSRDDAPAELLRQALAAARAARARGYEVMRQAHAAAWAELWRGEVRVEGDAALDRQARLDLFMLYQNAPVDRRFPMQIMGLAAPGYYGNVLWDVDCFSWPALLPFAPELAAATPSFRRRTLDAALAMATRHGHRGAYYPWQACAYAGEDNGPLPEHNRAIHLTFAVARMMWLQWCATGDRAFLRREAWPVLSAIADFACSRATWVPWAGRYEYHEVVGPEEPFGVIGNDLHTNAMAVQALRLAGRAAAILGLGADPQWQSVAERIWLPRNQRTGAWQPHEASDLPSPRRWIESCAYHLADLPVDEAGLRDALAPISQDESTVNVETNLPWNLSFHALAAARLGDAERFAQVLLRQRTVRVDPATFGLRCEMAGNDAGPYITGCGSLLQGLLHGGTGLYWDEAGLVPRHAPCLPAGVSRLTFTRLRWHGCDHAVEVDSAGLRTMRS